MRILERIFGITRNFAHEVIAIDVGTASLSAALAKKGLSSSIEVVSVLRYGMDFFASREGFDHQRRALYLLKTHIAQLMSDAHKALPGAKAIEISVSEPFFQQYRICKDFQRERPHDRIRRSELDEITAKLAGDAVRDLSIHSQSLRVVRSAMQKVRINGYELKDPIGYRGADLDIEFEVLLISGAFYEYLEEFRMRWFPRVALHYHSDPEMLEHALFASSSIQPPALLLDIGGEVTSIAIILEKKARVLCDPVFFGVRTLERRIAEVVRCDSAHAESLLRRYVAQTIDAQEAKRIAPLLDSAVGEWMTLVAQSFHRTHTGALRSIFFAGQGRDIPLFRRAIEQRSSDFTSSPVGLYELIIPLDRLLPPKLLSSGGDAILASLLLYA